MTGRGWVVVHVVAFVNYSHAPFATTLASLENTYYFVYVQTHVNFFEPLDNEA